MTFGKAAGLAAGFIGAFGLGVVLGPSIVHRDSRRVVAPSPQVAENAPPPVVEQKPPTPAPPPVRTPGPGRAGSAARRPGTVAKVAPPTHPELQQRLKRVFNRGADLNKAAEGFRSGEEFAAVAHAARNTKVPFMLLKHRVLEERMSLDAAIRASKPDLDAAAEARKARSAAKSDVASLSL